MATPQWQSVNWRLAVIAAWLCGSIVWLAIALRRIVRFQTLLRLAIPASEPIRVDADAIAREIGLARTPRVLVVPGRLPPCMWPLGRDYQVVLPEQMLAQCSRDATRMLLAHEFMHVRRGDHWVRLFELLATACYWWLPTLWWVRRGLRRAEEACCDADVLRQFPNDARDYAEALLATVGFLAGLESRRLPVPASGLGDLRFLQRRLSDIMSRPVAPRLTNTARLLVAGLCLIVLPWGTTIAARTNASEAPTESDASPVPAQNDSNAQAADTNQVDGDVPANETAEGDRLPEWTLDRLPAECIATYKRLSPDGRLVAFSGAVLSDTGERAYGIYVVELATGDVRKVFPGAIKTRPAWSPDSRRVAFGNNPSYGNNYPLVIVDIETGAIDETGAQGVGADWSPDGNQLAVTTDLHQGGSWIAGVPADGRIGIWDRQSRRMRLVSPSGYSLYDRGTRAYAMSGAIQPQWSPDGRWIAYTQRTIHKQGNEELGEDDRQRREIWVVSADGDHLRKAHVGPGRYQWRSESQLEITGEEQELTTVDVTALPDIAPNDLPRVPVDVAEALKARAQSAQRAAAFDVSPILEANRPWQRPSLDGIESVQFTHRMRPKRLDERFVWQNGWRHSGECFTEVIFRDDEHAAEEIGRISLVAPQRKEPNAVPEVWLKYHMKGNGRYPTTDVLRGRRVEAYMREHLIGTRVNFVALDWGRDPDAFRRVNASPNDDKTLVTLTLEPVIAPNRERYVLNAGIMFDTTSWAYVHDLRVARSELTIDTATHHIVKEVDYNFDGTVICEVTLSDWRPVNDSQAVPLQVRLAFPLNEFEVEQTYQWRPEGLWILNHAEAKFEGHEPQFAEVVELTVNERTREYADRLLRLEQLARAYGARPFSDLHGVRHFDDVMPHLQPFRLGVNEPLKWEPSAPEGELVRALRFTVGSFGTEKVTRWTRPTLWAEFQLPEQSPQPPADARLLLSVLDVRLEPVFVDEIPLADLLTDRPNMDAPQSAHTRRIVRSEDGLIVRLDLGHTPGLAAARFWNLTCIHADGTTTSLGGGQRSPITATLFPDKVPVTARVYAHSGNGKARILSMKLEKTADGHDGIRLELVSEDHFKELSNVVWCLLIDRDGIPVAAAQAQGTFRVPPGAIAVNEDLLLDFGRILPARRSLYVVLGLQSEVIGGSMGSRWGRFMNDEPALPVDMLLASPATDVIAAGLMELNRQLREVVSRLVEDADYVDEDKRIASLVIPHRDRLFELRTSELEPSASELWCVLAGYTGDRRFVEPLQERLRYEDGDVADAAAVGLALLGSDAGLARVKRLAEQTDEHLNELTNIQERLRRRNRRDDARLALGRIQPRSD